MRRGNGLALKMGFWSVAVLIIALSSKGIVSYAGGQEASVGQQIDKELSVFFNSLSEFFADSMLLIIPDKSGAVLLVRTTDFASDSTKVINQEQVIPLDRLGSVLLEKTKGDANKASHLFLAAKENVDYKYIFQVVNRYEEALKLFPQHNTTKLNVTLWQPFATLNDLKGFKSTR